MIAELLMSALLSVAPMQPQGVETFSTPADPLFQVGPGVAFALVDSGPILCPRYPGDPPWRGATCRILMQLGPPDRLRWSDTK